MRGRPADPPSLKLVKGIPGNRPVDPDTAVNADPAEPECPAHLDERAQAEWRRIVPELIKVGLLSLLDRAALALYCQAFARWELAEEKIAELATLDAAGAGLVRKGANGFEQLTYWGVISGQAQEKLLKYLQEFGLSPSTRARVQALRKQGSLFDDDPMEALLRAGSKAPKAG